MDILAIKPSTISVDIKHPATGNPIGLVIECVSMESDEVKVVERRIKAQALKARGQMTPETIDSNAMALRAAAIVGWAWDDALTLGALSNPPLTDANKAALLAVPWIAKQVDQALGDEAAFFQA